MEKCRVQLKPTSNRAQVPTLIKGIEISQKLIIVKWKRRHKAMTAKYMYMYNDSADKGLLQWRASQLKVKMEEIKVM